MKKLAPVPVIIDSIAGMHRMLGLPGPLHPLISMVDNTNIEVTAADIPESFILDFISYRIKK